MSESTTAAEAALLGWNIGGIVSHSQAEPCELKRSMMLVSSFSYRPPITYTSLPFSAQALCHLALRRSGNLFQSSREGIKQYTPLPSRPSPFAASLAPRLPATKTPPCSASWERRLLGCRESKSRGVASSWPSSSVASSVRPPRSQGNRRQLTSGEVLAALDGALRDDFSSPGEKDMYRRFAALTWMCLLQERATPQRWEAEQ
mmetsp:Transcript_61294/g.179129  ORF Transcript_61294/g.179129 Transcript_61294/m.179129 type:complete len:203 (-) Transcript_61294:1244-1852(-)